MRTSNRVALIAGILLLILQQVEAQQIDSLMNLYLDRASPEKIHIHFDRSVYNKGETIFYKAYVLHRGDSASQNIYLEWFDEDGKPLTRSVAPLFFSSAVGSFDIPTNYTGNVLQVKAYTRWMLNDDPELIFHRTLRIYTGNDKPISPSTAKILVDVFPEGGTLVEGLRSRIAFKATNAYGTPVPVQGWVENDKGTLIDSLRVQHDGMGSFYLLPLPGEVYRLHWVDEWGGKGSLAIPTAKKQGATLAVTRSQQKIRFVVQRTEGVDAKLKQMYLLVHMNQVLLYQVAINAIEKSILSSELPLDGIPTGLLQFTLFSSDWIPVAERVLFVNDGTATFQVSLDATSTDLNKRGKNILDIKVPDTLLTNMSLSITDALINPSDEHTIFSDLLLSSEIKGKVHNPAYYFSAHNAQVEEDLDLVMLTHAWRRFDWERIRAGLPPQREHAMEMEHMKLTGQVTGLRKNSLPADLNLVLLGADSTRQIASVPIDKNGKFEYSTAFFDTSKVFFSMNNNPSATERMKVVLTNGLWNQKLKSIELARIDEDVWLDETVGGQMNQLLKERETLRKHMVEATLQEVVVHTKVKTRKELLNEKYASGFFRGSPTRGEYLLDLTDPHKPTSAFNVLEYLESQIPGLRASNNGVTWRNHGVDFYLNEMRVDLETIRDVPLISIAIVKAFPPLFMFSAGGGAGGAVAVYTRLGNDMPPVELKGLSYQLISGYTKFKEFYHPPLETTEEAFQQTDDRITLYWEPHVITNASSQQVRIEFRNNDRTKRLRVVLEGVNAAGKMIRIEKLIGE